MLLDFIMMRARIWDRRERYVRTWEPDTSDIPEMSSEWFKTAKWSDNNGPQKATEPRDSGTEPEPSTINAVSADGNAPGDDVSRELPRDHPQDR